MSQRSIIIIILSLIAINGLVWGAYSHQKKANLVSPVIDHSDLAASTGVIETNAVVTIDRTKIDARGVLILYYTLIIPGKEKSVPVSYGVDDQGVWEEPITEGKHSFPYDTTQLSNGHHTFTIAPWGGTEATVKMKIYNLMGPIEVSPLLDGHDPLIASLSEPAKWTVTVSQKKKVLAVKQGYGTKIKWIWDGKGAQDGDVLIQFKAEIKSQPRPIIYEVTSYYTTIQP